MQTPMCAYCKHFNAEVRDENVCAAFPDGIPDEIAFKNADHTKPFKGDHGIRFEAIPGFEYMNDMDQDQGQDEETE
jgi:hypothetical protein